MKNQSASNHERAPICAAFVKLMREVFGDDVKVLWLKEGDLEMGKKTDGTVLHSP